MNVIPLSAALLLIAASSVAAQCPSTYPDGGRDYRDPAQQEKIRSIEHYHLNANVENLVRGQSATIGEDLAFVLKLVPNHHRALNAMMQLGLRDRKESPDGTAPYKVQCWLHRATVLFPDDGTSFLIYGVYLGRLGRVDAAIAQLERADELKPNDQNVTYNLGLMYFEKKDYARSLEAAKRAYAAGSPLQGLRRKLEQAGQWRE